MSVSASIPDTSLGLTSSEIQILRQQQQIALQGGHGANGVSRGRGTGRTSNSSSRAASAASSHGRLILDPMSLRALSHQLDGLQQQIRNRLDDVGHTFFSGFLHTFADCAQLFFFDNYSLAILHSAGSPSALPVARIL